MGWRWVWNTEKGKRDKEGGRHLKELLKEQQHSILINGYHQQNAFLWTVSHFSLPLNLLCKKSKSKEVFPSYKTLGQRK